MKNHTFIFIGGLHRSGTSLLHQVLKDHPEISGFSDTGVPEDEGQHLQSVYLNAKSFGGPGYFARNTDSYMDEHHPLATPTSAQILYSEWSRYWNLEKPYLVEKSPPNIVRTRFLQALFPNAYFITLFRHPIAVAMATQKWAKCSISDLVEHGLIAYERFSSDAKKLSNSRIIRYESMISNTTSSLNDLLYWLKLPPHKFNIEVQKNLNNRYYSSWAELPLQERAHIIDTYEQRANQIGYSLKELT